MKSMISQKRQSCPVDFDECFYGSVTVGERGQIVIPAEARVTMGIQQGDKLLIMKHPAHHGLMVFKLEEARAFLDDFSAKLAEAEEKEDK